MPVLNCLSQHHSLLVACFVTATYALALSCALLCLSITLLLLSHVPCFVSASRCSCFLMCLALSQHHAALAFSCALLCLSITLHSISCRSYSHVPSFVSVLLSQVLWFVSASLTPFLLSHVPNLPCYRSCSCALLCLNITPLLLLTLSQGITLLFKCSLCALLCLAQHHDALSSASPQHHAAHVPCLVSAWHHAALQCSAFSPRYFPGYSIDCSTYVVTKLSNELEINGSEILYCPMN